MKESNIYLPLWQKCKPVIVSKMKLATTGLQEYQLSKHEFEAIGNRSQSGYSFNLEINNGVVANNIDGSAVARDLFEVLRQSEAARELMKNKNYKITFSKTCRLEIQVV